MIKLIQNQTSRYYQVEGEIKKYPSVTAILSCLNKPGLLYWEKSLSLKFFGSEMLRTIENVASKERAEMEKMIESLQSRAMVAPLKERNQAAEFGREAHGLIEDMLSGKSVSVPPSHQLIADGFQKWKADYGDLEIVNVEKNVLSKIHGYAGCVDCVAVRPFSSNSDPNPNPNPNPNSNSNTSANSNNANKVILMDWKTSNSTWDEYALQLSAYAQAYTETTGTKVDEAYIVRLAKSGKPGYYISQVRNLDEAFGIFLSCFHLWKAFYAKDFAAAEGEGPPSKLLINGLKNQML